MFCLLNLTCEILAYATIQIDCLVTYYWQFTWKFSFGLLQHYYEIEVKQFDI